VKVKDEISVAISRGFPPTIGIDLFAGMRDRYAREAASVVDPLDRAYTREDLKN